MQPSLEPNKVTIGAYLDHLILLIKVSDDARLVAFACGALLNLAVNGTTTTPRTTRTTESQNDCMLFDIISNKSTHAHAHIYTYCDQKMTLRRRLVSSVEYHCSYKRSNDSPRNRE